MRNGEEGNLWLRWESNTVSSRAVLKLVTILTEPPQPLKYEIEFCV